LNQKGQPIKNLRNASPSKISLLAFKKGVTEIISFAQKRFPLSRKEEEE